MSIKNYPTPDDSWAQVELYRWQYGELPPQDDTCKILNVPDGFEGMARAFDGDRSKKNPWPAPSNVASVLRYAAKLLRKGKQT